jgi:hypothetical protein
MVKQVTQRHALEPLITLTSLNGQLFDSTVPLLFDRSDPRAVVSAQLCYRELLTTGRLQGWFPYRLGVDAMDELAALQTDSRAFTARLRQSIDPQGLMAPGRYN